MKPIPTSEMDRAQWLSARRSGIGGSDAPAILGLSPWRTAVDVWLEKTGRSAGQEENDAMYWGTRLENLVAQEYALRTGREVRRHNFMPRSGVLVGNVDRLVCDGPGIAPAHKGKVRCVRILEAKTTRTEAGWEDGAPDYYVAQVLHYMGLLPTVQTADIAVLFLSERKFETYEITREPAVIAAMQERLTEWWVRHVVEDAPPEPQNEADCRRVWTAHRPGTTATASAEVEAACILLKDLAQREKALEAEKAELRAKVESAIRDAEALTDPAGTVLATWKANKPTLKTDWEAVAAELEAPSDTVARHTSVRPGARVLRLK